MPPPQCGVIKPRPVIIPIQCIARQLVVLKFFAVVEVLVFGSVLAVEVLLLHGHTKGVVAGLLQQLGLAVAVGGKDYTNVSQMVFHAIFIFPICTVANIYGHYPHIAGKDSD